MDHEVTSSSEEDEEEEVKQISKREEIRATRSLEETNKPDLERGDTDTESSNDKTRLDQSVTIGPAKPAFLQETNFTLKSNEENCTETEERLQSPDMNNDGNEDVNNDNEDDDNDQSAKEAEKRRKRNRRRLLQRNEKV